MNLGIVSAFSSAAIYSVSNFIDKFLLEKHNLNYYVITVYSGIATFVAGTIITLFAGLYLKNVNEIFFIILSGFFVNISLLPYYKALTNEETSQLIPLFQFIPVIVILMDFFILGEKMTTFQYIGSFIIIISSFILSMEKSETKIFTLKPGFFYMIFSCFLYAVSVICYKIGVKEVPFWQSLFYEGVGTLVCSFTILTIFKKWNVFVKQTKKIKKRVYGYLLLNESTYLLSRYAYYFALTLITASLASVLQGLQPLITLIYGILLTIFFPKIIKERIEKPVLLFKSLCIVGIIIGLYFIFYLG